MPLRSAQLTLNMDSINLIMFFMVDILLFMAVRAIPNVFKLHNDFQRVNLLKDRYNFYRPNLGRD